MSNPRYAGKKRNLALFESRGKVVLVDTVALTASVESIEDTRGELSSKGWDVSSNPDPIWIEIASVALSKSNAPTQVTLAQANKRGYTVPKQVALSAKTALERNSASLSATSKHMASILASGAQISCEDALWCSRFFSENTPETATRESWLAWGGDAGMRWSTALADRVGYDSVTADGGGYDTPGITAFLSDPNLEAQRAFYTELLEPRSQFCDGLYMLTPTGTWTAWGNGDWFTCDAPTLSERFVELDEESALYVAGALFDAPEVPVDLRSPNPEAWDLAVEAYDDIDWEFVDRTMVAAGAPTEDYTTEERSQDASSQLRDANGRFATVGDSGAIKSNGLGAKILSADQTTGQLKVQTDDGQTFDIPSSDFEVGAQPHPKVDPDIIKNDKNLDLTGIVAPAPDPVTAKATLSDTPNLMSPIDINDSLEEFSKRITDERQAKAKEFEKLLDTPETTVVAAAEGDDLPATTGEDTPPPSADPTPDDSDVEPVYLALVDRDDPRSVMELVALVPSTATSSEPKTFKRSGGKWVEDPKILADLRSATPPAMVQLDKEQYEDVIFQIDSAGTTPEEDESVVAAGGLDKNRGNAEDLRRYWTVGPGGLKIRWKTGGDWTRCVKLLSKHLGPRAKGYCALRHKEMNGVWPGDRKNREASVQGLVASGISKDSGSYLKTTNGVIRASANFAAVEVAKAKVYGNYEFKPVIPTADEIHEGRSGKAFTIPLVIPEGIPTGDGRTFSKGAIGMRTFPIPLLWQPATGEGHDTSYIVGRIDRMERTGSGIGNAYGVFDTGPYGKEAQRLVENKMLRWVSADLDKFEVDEENSDPETGKMLIKKGRVMGVTLVAKPAFQECTIELISREGVPAMSEAIPSAISASASIAAAIPVEPPLSWFEDPQLSGPTPIQVDNNGRLFGHIATWDTRHIGMAGEVNPPRSSSNYAYFHTGVVRTAEGNDVKVGQLTLSGGHAPIHLDASAAVRHYDDTHSAFADVHAGEDAYGIWVAGALRPGTGPAEIRALRASAPSGDWRAINRRLELVAVCQVNVPGFPVPRALAASAGSQEQFALVAAGTADLWAMRTEQGHESLESVRTRMDAALNIAEYISRHKGLSSLQATQLFEEGVAMRDGSFQIETPLDLQKALRVYSSVEANKQASVRRHIVRRARSLGKMDTLPKNWKELALSDKSLTSRDRYEEMVFNSRTQKLASLSARVNTQESLAARVAQLKTRIEKN
ncbi:MAG: hypothetical protein E6R04_07325 [Spirochaetes bacterium]|nr:MAG: hypothetical protein E6R04_07325 [Spirochaetota bacterium]